jgi:hypothetical protein
MSAGMERRKCSSGEFDREVEEGGVIHHGLPALWYSIAVPVFLKKNIPSMITTNQHLYSEEYVYVFK